MPGSRNGAARHELAQAREVLGRGRADDGADVREPDVARLAELAHDRREALVDRRRRRAAGPGRRPRRGSRCARGRTAPASSARAASTNGASESRAEERVDGHRVGAETLDVAERRRRGAERAPGRRRRRRRRCRRACRRRSRAGRRSRAWATVAVSAVQPGAPRRSKQASCGLTATQAGPAASMSAAQCAVTAAAARSAGGAGCRDGAGGVRPQPRGIGIEPEDDLALAAPRRGRRGGRRSSSARR